LSENSDFGKRREVQAESWWKESQQSEIFKKVHANYQLFVNATADEIEKTTKGAQK